MSDEEFEEQQSAKYSVKICAHLDRHGHSCGLPGIFGWGLKGEGPWYCREHDPLGSFRDGDGKFVPPQSESVRDVQAKASLWLRERGIIRDGMTESERVDACRAECARLGKLRTPEPSRDWAPMLQSRIADGESIPSIAGQLSLAVLQAMGDAVAEEERTQNV